MKILILILALFTLSGCYNYVEVENMDIVSSIVVDYKNEKYNIKLEVVEKDKTKVIDGTGTSLSEAFESISLISPNKVYLSHLNAVLFTKSVDLKELTNYFLREPKVNTTFYFLLTEKADVYQDTNLGEDIYKILENHNVFNFFHIAKIVNDNNKDIIIPYYNSDLKIRSGYIFHDNKAVKEVDYDLVEIYKLLDNINDSNLLIDNIDISISNVNTVITYDKYFKIDVNCDITILQNNSDYNLNKSEDVLYLEKIIDKEINIRINNLLDILIEYRSDIFGFSDLIINSTHNDLKNWYNQEFKIDVTSHISKKGLLKS